MTVVVGKMVEECWATLVDERQGQVRLGSVCRVVRACVYACGCVTRRAGVYVRMRVASSVHVYACGCVGAFAYDGPAGEGTALGHALSTAVRVS